MFTRQLIILYCLLLLTPSAFSQNNILEGVYLESDEEIIAKIDLIKKELDGNIASLTEVEKTDSAGYRYVYFDGHELKIIKSFYKENELYKSASWYFHKGRLIYAESFWTDESMITWFSDERLYFENEHLLQWIIGNTIIDKSSAQFKKASEEIVSFALKLKLENRFGN